MPIHRKQPRLSAPYYRGFRTHFVTICCDLRHSYLSDPSNARLVQDRLLETASRNSFLLHAYCLMPDHLHLLVQEINSSADLREFIRVFKLRTAFEFRKPPAGVSGR
jgi:REP element-mobilizing transposase RayT